MLGPIAAMLFRVELSDYELELVERACRALAGTPPSSPSSFDSPHCFKKKRASSQLDMSAQ